MRPAPGPPTSLLLPLRLCIRLPQVFEVRLSPELTWATVRHISIREAGQAEAAGSVEVATRPAAMGAVHVQQRQLRQVSS